MYTVKESIVGKNVTKIEIFKDDTRVKLIMNSVKEKAYQQRDYYLKMMNGVNNYTQWLKEQRAR